MSLMRRVRTPFLAEEGSILVIAAAAMGAVLLLGAMAIDTGNWFTHKRQLQNRADAGAFAAAVEYDGNWRACLTGDTTVAQAISDKARQYAGDPTFTGGTLQNTQVADQSKLRVNINKTGWDATSPSDGGGPCYVHPAGTDPISPLGGVWTDVKVDESSVPLFFSGFGVAPPRISTQARVQLNPILDESKFSPLALQVSRIYAAQVRLYNECTGALLGKYNLQPLGNAAQSVSGETLWGNPDGNGNNSFVSVPVPTATGCTDAYVRIGSELRIVGRPNINPDSVACPSSVQYIDCYTDNSGRWGPEARVWKSGDASTGPPTFKDVHLSGGTCSPDAYFSTAANCQTNVAVDIDFGDRNKGDSTQFTVTVNGITMNPPSATNANGVWTSSVPLALGAAGGTNLTLDWTWKDNNTTDSWRTNQCTAGNNTPCKGSATGIAIHSAYVATDTNSGIVQLFKLTNSANIDPLTASEFDSVTASGATANVYLTVGLQSTFSVGPLLKVRTSTAQGSGSINCNNVNQGGTQTFNQFVIGCTPFYGVNSAFKNDTVDPTWWFGTPRDCPSPQSFPANSQTAPWRCAPAAPGLTPSTVADGIAAKTGNCNISNNNNGCVGSPSCGNPNRWVAGTQPSTTDPRLITVFLVPYGAFNNTTGGSYSVPVIDFGHFYVTAWGGSNPSNTDPCGDALAGVQAGEIDGHFVDLTFPNSNPDPTDSCDPNQLRPCLATLVR